MLKHLIDQATKPERVVILGSAGFVGNACTQRLKRMDIPVLELPRTELDLTDSKSGDLLADLLRPNDSLLFVSAKAPVKTESMLIDNLQMASTVCYAILESPPQHLVYISSDAVYADSDEPLDESSCAQPDSLHGIMHLAREVMLKNAWQGPLCFLRPTLIYGAEDPHNGYGPNRFIRLAKKKEDILLFGEGEERRDHVWLQDVSDLICRVLSRRSTGILNIATGNVVSFREIAEQVTQITPNSSQIKNSPRSGLMPHNGYRAFDPAVTHHAFSDFTYTNLNDGLRKVYG
jgi:UDP-glucose 4-epimerase